MNENEFKKKLGKKIKIERVTRDLTQEQLAEKVDDTCHSTYISSVERGQITPTVFRLAKIAKIFNVNVDNLLSATNYLEEL